MDQQLRAGWPELLTPVVALANPLHGQLLGGRLPGYYHSIDQSEWATDVMFNEPAGLRRLYPHLVRHGMLSLGCTDIMRFMGRTIRGDGTPAASFGGDAATDLKHRPQGVRLKYRVADAHRRAQVSRAANERYLDAAAAVARPTTLGERVRPLCRPVAWQGKCVRALNPTADADRHLLAAVARGEHLVNGFRNRDVRQLLHGEPPADPATHRKQSAAVTRRLRLLRAHGLIKKVPKTHRYQVTDQGRQAITALMAAQAADVATLAAA